MVKQSQALKSVRAASTIDGKDMVFDFDEQIISSNAYRRAFNSFVNAPPQQNTEPDNTHDKDVSIVDSGISSMTVGGDDSGTSNLATRQIKKDQSQKVKRKSIPKSFEPPVPMSELPANIKNLTMLLHKAVEKGHATLVENLIRKGARLDVGDANGNLTTHIAATGGKSDVLDVLLQKGVIDIEATNFEDNRALNLACVHGHLAAVRVLLRFGADVSGKGMLGWSPLVSPQFHFRHFVNVISQIISIMLQATTNSKSCNFCLIMEQRWMPLRQKVTRLLFRPLRMTVISRLKG